MKLNNKGFAITGVLYTVFVLFLLIITSVLAGLQLKRTMLERSVLMLEDSYVGDNLYESAAGKGIIKKINEKSESNTGKVAPVTGKYIFNIRNNFYLGENSVDFTYTGTVQTFTAKEKGYYKLEVWGASGGGDDVNKGGKGGYSSGLTQLNEGDTLYVYVGGKGLSNATIENAGGWNGGGYSGNNTSAYSYGGGGATDIRRVKASENDDTVWYDEYSLNKRIIVAGGGGGTGNDTFHSHYAGVGGGLIGGTGTGSYNAIDSGGGTQEGPGSAVAGKQGLFGSGIRSSVGVNKGYGGGGGGGYYGGSTGHGKPGGGGSGYISPELVNGATIAGSQNVPEYPKQDEGNGYARITYYGEDAASLEGLSFLYGYTGTAQTFTPIFDGKYKIEAWGAQGGGILNNPGGNGAYTSGSIDLNSGSESLYIYVGNYGYRPQNKTSPFNGGGVPDTTSDWAKKNYPSGDFAGGGATDIRYFNTTPFDTSWNKNLNDRIMVAAGGGGGNNNDGSSGGVGGALEGGTTKDVKTGNNVNVPTQISGNSFGIGQTSGVHGQGGDNNQGADTGAGGGGYYGGYRGLSTNCGGSGGSSYISGYLGSIAVTSASDSSPKCTDGTTDVTCSYHYSGKKFENAKMHAGDSGLVPSPVDVNFMTGNSGDGYAKITYYGNGDVKVTDITCMAYLTKGTPINLNNISFLTPDCNEAKKNSSFAFEASEEEYNVITLAAVYSFER